MKNFLIIIIIVFTFQNNILSQRKHQDTSKEEGLRSLVLFKEFLSIPNDARNKEDIFKNIVWSTNQLNTLGFTTKSLNTSSLPLVVASKIINEKLPTIAFYMHLDGQAVDPSKWDQESPWIPVIKKYNGSNWEELNWNEIYADQNEDIRIYARSSS